MYRNATALIMTSILAGCASTDAEVTKSNALMRSLAGNGDVDGSIMVIGKVEQQVGSALLGVLGAKVKQVQGITSAVSGILSSFTGVDNKLDGTFNIKQGVLNTQDFAFVNPRARGTAKGDFDIGGWAMDMIVDLFGAEAQEAFMSIALDGPMTPTPKFATNGAAGATGLMGLTQQGAFNPAGLVQEIPGLEKLPGIGSLLGGGKAAAPSGAEGQPGATIPGVGTVPGVKLPGGVQDLLGGGNKAADQGKQQKQQPGAALPGLENLLGGTKKKKQEEAQPQPQQSEPGAVAPGAALPQPAEPAPAEAAPEQPAPAEEPPATELQQPEPEPQQPQAEPGAVLPGAEPQQPQPEQQPGILIPGLNLGN